MIIEQRKYKPFKWMVIDDRRKLMDQFGPTGGWWSPFCEHMNTKYNLNENEDFTFEDLLGPGRFNWRGTYLCFKDLKYAEMFEKEFGDVNPA